MKLATHQRDLIDRCRDKPSNKEIGIDLTLCLFAWLWLLITLYPKINYVCIVFMSIYTIIQFIKVLYLFQIKKLHYKWRKHVLGNYEFAHRKYAHAELFNIGVNYTATKTKPKLTIKVLTHVGVLLSLVIAKMFAWFFVYAAAIVAQCILTVYHTYLLQKYVKEITPNVIKIDQDKLSPYFYAKEFFPVDYAWRPVLTKGQKNEPIKYATAQNPKNKKRKRHVKYNSF